MSSPTTGLAYTDEERAILRAASALTGRAAQQRRRARMRARVEATWPELTAEEIEPRVQELISGEMRALARRRKGEKRGPYRPRKNLKNPPTSQPTKTGTDA